MNGGAVGNKTSFRRDCDVIITFSIPCRSSVGNKTSFRRDCDMISPAEQQTSRAAVLI